MKRARMNQLRHMPDDPEGPGSTRPGRQIGSALGDPGGHRLSENGGARQDSLGPIPRAAVAVLFALARWAMQGLAWAHFRHFDTWHRERFPRHGAALVVANHPAAWTDVLVLDVALDRKLHFIAYERLFRPRLRGWLMRLFGSLPVRLGHEAQAAEINRETFTRCHSVLDRQEVVAFFPEGVSARDRTLGPLRTGAARLLAERVSAGPGAPPLIPVAIHYEDRTRFRGDVVVAVGEPISTALLCGGADSHADGVRALTAEMAAAMSGVLASAARHADDLRAARLATMRAAIERPRWGIRQSISGMTTIFAGLGAILHALPWWAVEFGLQRMAPLPQQAILVRIGLGVLAFPLWYALLASVMVLMLGVPWYCCLIVPLLGAATARALDRRRARAEAMHDLHHVGVS